MSDLTDFYAPDDLPQSDDERAHWQINSDGACQWALLRLARAEQELARINERADELIEHAKAWRGRASAQAKRDAEFFRGAAADYHRRRLQPIVEDITADGVVDKDAWAKVKGKTYPLPVGDLVAKRSQDGIEIEDAEAFVKWALANGHVGLVSVTPSKAAIKDLPRKDGRIVTQEKDGEVVPGVRVVGGTVTFDAKATVTDEVPAYLPMPDDEEVA